jgi:hypothetical protein
MKLVYVYFVNLLTCPLPRKNKVTADDLNDIKEVVNNNAGVEVYKNISNTGGNITFTIEITDYSMIDVFYEASREAGDSGTSEKICGSQRLFDPIGKCFNINVLNQVTDDHHTKGYTATFKVSSTGINKIASSLYELNQLETAQYVMNSYNAVRIKYVLAYK